MTIHKLQNLNRATIEYASTVIVPGMTLFELRKLCEADPKSAKHPILVYQRQILKQNLF